MIDNMVATLKKEQQDDNDKKEYCEMQFDVADDKKKSLERSVANLEKAIAKEKEGIKALAEEIKALEESIVALDKSVAEATAQRKDENVEYNQLEPLLVSTGHQEGDTNGADGFSPYPGNQNGLVFSLPEYVETMRRTGGQLPEFINPKFADDTRTAFKSPARLECMMQDYPKALSSDARVGFTRYPLEFGYFPCKNDIATAARLSAAGVPPHGAASSEAAVYHANCTMLRLLGADVAPPARRTWRGGERLKERLFRTVPIPTTRRWCSACARRRPASSARSHATVQIGSMRSIALNMVIGQASAVASVGLTAMPMHSTSRPARASPRRVPARTTPCTSSRHA